MSFETNLSKEDTQGKTTLQDTEMGKMTEETIFTNGQIQGLPRSPPQASETTGACPSQSLTGDQAVPQNMPLWALQDDPVSYYMRQMEESSSGKSWNPLMGTKLSDAEQTDPLMSSASSDKFGLGSSTSSFGYQRASEMVSMILGEDDLGNSINRLNLISSATEGFPGADDGHSIWQSKPQSANPRAVGQPLTSGHQQWSETQEMYSQSRQEPYYPTVLPNGKPPFTSYEYKGGGHLHKGQENFSPSYWSAGDARPTGRNGRITYGADLGQEFAESMNYMTKSQNNKYSGYGPQHEVRNPFDVKTIADRSFENIAGFYERAPKNEMEAYKNRLNGIHKQSGQLFNNWGKMSERDNRKHGDGFESKVAEWTKGLYVRGPHGTVYSEPRLPNGHDTTFIPESPQEITTPRGWSPVHDTSVPTVVREGIRATGEDLEGGDLPSTLGKPLPFPPGHDQASNSAYYPYRPALEPFYNQYVQREVQSPHYSGRLDVEERMLRRAPAGMATVGSGSPPSTCSPLGGGSDSSQSEKSRGYDISSAPGSGSYGHPGSVGSPEQALGVGFQQVPYVSYPQQFAQFTYPGQAVPMYGAPEVMFSQHQNQFLQPIMTPSGEVYLAPPMFTYHPGIRREHHPPKRSGPANDLHNNLETCYEQFKMLEKERKKTEAELALQHPGKNVSSHNTVQVPRLNPNPSRVDRLVIDSLQEYAKVITLLQQMENLSGKKMQEELSMCLNQWSDSIKQVQTKRKEEIVNANNRHRVGGPRYLEDKDVLALSAALGDLTQSTQRARTAQWCALQLASNDLPAYCKTALHPMRPSLLSVKQKKVMSSSRAATK